MHALAASRMLRASAVLAGALAGSGPVVDQVDGPSWPRFHGPNGDNVSAETGLLEEWPEGGPRLLWMTEELGHGFGSVAIADGMICAVGDVDESCIISAMDLDGTVQWRFAHGASWRGPTPGARTTPTIHGPRVCCENAHGAVVCLDARSGQRIWGRDIAEEFGGRSSSWGYAESLVIDGDRVICCPGGDTAMVALDARTGETVWESPSAGEPAGYSTPVLAEHHGLRMILVSNGGIRPSQNPLVESVFVSDGPDVADMWIAERAGVGDVVITGDIPLAAKCVEAGAKVLKHNGEELHARNIGQVLATRDLMQDLRSADPFRQGGGKPFSKTDRSRFSEALERVTRAAKAL